MTFTVMDAPAARSQESLTRDQHFVTYRLVRIGANESKQLPQQDTVSGLVPAVLDGQRLQECKGAAAVAGHVTTPTENKAVIDEQTTMLREAVWTLRAATHWDPALTKDCLPLIGSIKFQVFVTNHFQVRRSRHASKENRLPDSVRGYLCF